MQKSVLLLSLLLIGLSSCVEQKTNLIFSSSAFSNFSSTTSKYPIAMQMVERRFAADIIKKAFDVEPGTDESTWIDNNIYKKVEFGGGCDPYAESDLSATTVEFPSEVCGAVSRVQASTNNPMRFALAIKTCEYLTERPSAMSSFRLKVIGGSWKAPDAKSINKAWALFYPAHPLNAETQRALMDIKNASTSHEQAWKLIAFTICSSPAWQVH